MKIDIRELDDRYAKLVIEDVHPYMMNALRRTLLAEVPKLAIEKVTFYDNTSALFDEIVAHRISLLPVPTEPSTLNLVDQEDDEGNPSFIVRYTLTKEGPCTVYSGDLEPEDDKYKIADPKVPIVDLLEGQRLILECEARLGRGTEHAKWMPCQAVGYKYYPTAKVDNRKIKADDLQLVLERTPVGVLGEDGGKLIVLDEENVNRADYACEVLGEGFQVTYDDRKFIFTFETDGSLKAEDALMKALEILKERFKAFSAALAEA